LSLADDHTAGVLTEMARQVLHFLRELKKFVDAVIREIKTCVLELAGEGIVRISIFPRADQAGEAIQGFRIKGKNFSDFARGGFAAIGNHVGGHGGAKCSVAFVNVLNGALALVAAGQIQVNVRPLAAFFGEKAFEE
jgi:hypothetical protein